MRSSKKSFDLIVTEEDSDQRYYVAHYQHFDFPGGASGPTVAIGYDCGYVTTAEAIADWTGIVDANTITHIVAACGLTGARAHAFVQQHGSSVTIPWDAALREFSEREMPKWEARVAAALPNTDKLPADCFGALTSLSYNRGTGGFHDPSPRDAEMRAITAHMRALQFDKIPDEILSMRRLWPKEGDLWRRRGHEADLFRAGLMGSTQPAPALHAPVQRPARTTRVLQSDLNMVLQLHPPLDVDGDFGDKTEEALIAFQKLNPPLDPDGIPGNLTWKALEAAL